MELPPDPERERIDRLLAPVLAEEKSRREQLTALETLRVSVDGEGEEFLERLVTTLLEKMHGTGSEQEDARFAAELARCCGDVSSLAAAVRTLHEVSAKRLDSLIALDLSLLIVRRVLLQRPSNTDDDVWTANLDKFAVEPWVNSVTLLPGLMANASQAVGRQQLPIWSIRKNYYPRLVENAASMAIIHGNNDEGSRSAFDYFAALVQRLVRNRGGDDVTVGLHHFYDRRCRTKDDERTRGLLSDLVLQLHLDHLSDRESATLCRSILQHIISKMDAKDSAIIPEPFARWLELSFVPIVASSRDKGDALVRLVVLSPQGVLHDTRADQRLLQIFSRLLGTVVPTGLFDDTYDSDDSSDDEDGDGRVDVGRTERVLWRQLNMVGESWSSIAFVRRTEYKMQRHVTCFLVSGLTELSNKLDPTAPLVLKLLNGVEARLHSSYPEIRRDGMRVGEQLGRMLGQEVKFEELDEEREQEKCKEEGLHVSTSEPANEDAKGLSESMKKKEKSPGFSAEEVSDEDVNDGDTSRDYFDDDSDWEDDSAITPYDLEDDEEDLREAPRPLYLRDCMDLILTPETEANAVSCHETALQEISRLVRSRPVDLMDVGPELARRLLRMENKFDLNRFAEMVADSLCSLAVEEPVSVGNTLIAELFQDGHLAGRIRTLKALGEAAYELSGGKHLERGRSSAEQLTYQGPRVSGKRALIQADKVDASSLVSKTVSMEETGTRRWGKGRRKAEFPVFSNKFAEVAPIWFYNLIQHFMESKDDPTLWGGEIGSKLLASFLVTLAGFVECSGLSPGTEVLAKDLFELAWSFRCAEVAEVRASVLYSAACSIGFLRDEVVLGLIMDASENFPLALNQIATSDPDNHCRSLARLVSNRVAAAVQAVEQGRPLLTPADV